MTKEGMPFAYLFMRFGTCRGGAEPPGLATWSRQVVRLRTMLEAHQGSPQEDEETGAPEGSRAWPAIREETAEAMSPHTIMARRRDRLLWAQSREALPRHPAR